MISRIKANLEKFLGLADRIWVAFRSGFREGVQDRPCGIPGGRLDRSHVQPSLDAPEGKQCVFRFSTLGALAYWKPPRDGSLELIACVRLGDKFLFVKIEPEMTAMNVVNELDKVACVLLCVDSPNLDKEWVNQLNEMGNNLEEYVIHAED